VIEGSLPPGMEFDEREVVLLGILDRQAAHIERLEAELAAAEYVDVGSMGQSRVNPLVAELRQQYSAMARVAESIRLPSEVERPKAIRQQRAANTRWGNH